jgi:oligosaccharide repeat unit polymerase
MLKFDLLNPIFIILYAFSTLLICDIFFYSLSIYVYLITILGYLLFLLFIFLFLNKKIIWYKMLPKQIYVTKQEKIFFLCLIILSFFASIELIIIFSNKFSFLSIFYNSSLLQNNAISNSLGYLLYLNVIILPYSIFRIFYTNDRSYILVLILSLFFLYFTGIKGYLFLGIINTLILFIYFSSTKRALVLIILALLIMISYFIFYDFFLDLSSNNISDSLHRFMAYFVGSWAVADLKILENWETPYYGFKTFPFIYKLLGYGTEYQELYNVFYNVNGLKLNVVPFIQYAFIEGGLFLQTLIIFLLSIIVIIFRKLLFYSFSIYYLFFYIFVMGNFILSLTFANTIGGLKFYTTICILFLLKFFIKILIKIGG